MSKNILGRKVENKIYEIALGFEMIPTVKKKFNEVLVNEFGVSEESIDSIYNLNFYNLTDDEKIKIMYALHNFTKDESINPDKVMKKNTFAMQNERSYYNYDYKYKYLDSHYSRSTKEVVMNYFRKSAEMEKRKQKDVYDFDKVEVEELLQSFNSTTIRSLQNIISTFSQYVENAIVSNQTNNVNYFKEYSTANDIKHLINKEKQSFFSEEEIQAIMNVLDNPQDAVIVGLIYEGLSIKKRGEQPFAELVNLKEKDIDFKNGVINITDADNNEFARTIDISNYLLDLLDVTIKEEEYFANSGIASEGLHNMRAMLLKNTEYVIKGIVGSGGDEFGYKSERINWKNINQRITKIANKTLDKDSVNFTARTISYSGQINYYAQLTSDIEKGDTEKHRQAVSKVFEKFGIKESKSSVFYFEKRVPSHILKK